MSNAMMPAAIKGKLRRRFYEAIVFLSALTTALEGNRQSACHDLCFNSATDCPFEAKFKNFVNTLSQFCDSKPGGDSVTAFSVLQFPDRIQYRFACNRMKSGLETIKAFVTDLLTTLREAGSREDLEQILWEKVLDHCRKRVLSYLVAFNKACGDCKAAQPVDAKLSNQLDQLRVAAPDADTKDEDSQAFARRCRQLVTLIEQSHQHTEYSVFAARAAHIGMNQRSSCWSQLRHYAGRLKSYSVGIRTLINTVKTFPQLIDKDFEVTYVRSSKPDPNPIAAKQVTVEEILGRMCPSQVDKLSFCRLLEENGPFDINEAIQEIVAKESFQPIVHAELLVLQSLAQDKLDRPPDFFHGWKYIGSSKPTCRLCHYYFQAHNGGFQVRSPHMNLYINWKPPDVFQRDGEKAIKGRERMMNMMVVAIRQEGLRTLKDRAPVGREHDSSTGMTSTNPLVGRVDYNTDMDTSLGESDDTSMN